MRRKSVRKIHPGTGCTEHLIATGGLIRPFSIYCVRDLQDLTCENIINPVIDWVKIRNRFVAGKGLLQLFTPSHKPNVAQTFTYSTALLDKVSELPAPPALMVLWLCCFPRLLPL
eukprot:2955473-Amphidinium_carterae.1